MAKHSGFNGMDFLIKYADNNRYFTRKEVVLKSQIGKHGPTAVLDAIKRAVMSGTIELRDMDGNIRLTRGSTAYESANYTSPLNKAGAIADAKRRLWVSI